MYCFSNVISDSLRTVSIFTSLESGTTDNREVILLHSDSLNVKIRKVNLCPEITPLFVPEVGKHYKWISQLDFESITSDTEPYVLMRNWIFLTMVT